MFAMYRKLGIFTLTLFAVLPFLAGCSGLPITNHTPTATPKPLGNGVIGWPFDTKHGQWKIENGYNTTPDHFGSEMYSFDFQRTDQPTAGQEVLSPVTGTSVDFQYAYPFDGTTGRCVSIGLSSPAYAGYHLLVCHLDHPVFGAITRGAHLGFINAVADHLHITLYYLDPSVSDTKANDIHRKPIPFSDPWTIGGCNYPANGSANQWANGPAPCGPQACLNTASVPTNAVAYAEVARRQEADTACPTATPKLPIGTIWEFATPTPQSYPGDLIVGPDGNLWFTEGGYFHPEGFDPALSAIGRITPSGVITEFSLPTKGENVTGIIVGPDGALWFTEDSAIGRITPSGSITEFPTPTPQSNPFSLIVGADGNLWFTENSAIGRITPKGVITEFPTPDPSNFPFGLVVGPDGALWFTDGIGAIGRITVGGVVTEFPTPTPQSNPGDLIMGPDGNLWFVENPVVSEYTPGRIGRITPDGVISEFPTPFQDNDAQDRGLGNLVVGPDGNLWLTVGFDSIGRITLDGTATEFRIPSSFSSPSDLEVGPDGNLWFTENSASKIGRITPSGVITEFQTPTTNSFPFALVVGTDGALWFTENGTNKIGRITP